METTVVADSESLWLIAGAIALALGLVGLGVNLNIRRARAANQKESEALRHEVRRLKAAQAGAAFVDGDLRQQALKEALLRRPDLADASDSESIAQLQSLVDQTARELALRREVQELKAHEEAERLRAEAAAEAARKIEEGRRQTEERRRLMEEQGVQQEELRRARLQAMSPSRRWIETHRPLVAGISIVSLGVLVAAGYLGITNFVRSQHQQELAAAAAEQAARDSEAARAEAERIAQLMNACDLTVPEQDIPDEVWISWLACEDPAAAARATNRAPRNGIDAATLDRLAATTPHAEVARFMTVLPNTPVSAHEALVKAWKPEVVGRSYAIVYDQPCSMGVEPSDYVGRSTFRTEDGTRVKFLVEDCVADGFPFEDHPVLNVEGPWVQLIGSVTIGDYKYLLDGSTLRLDPAAQWSDFHSPPKRLTRQD